MIDENSILVGIDMADDYTQICYTGKKGDVVSVSLSDDQTKYRIPTMVCAVSERTEWLYGEEAAGTVESDTVKPIRDLITLAMEDRGVEIFGRFYPADIILERFFGRLLPVIREKSNSQKISGIVITLRHCNPVLKKNIMSALELMGIKEDSIRIITYLESFMYYVVSQNCDIWINDVGLFDFDREGFSFYKLSFGRKQKPVNVVAEKSDLTENISYDMLASGEPEKLIEAFSNSVSQMLHKQIISALYFTGCGFESAWADESLKKLCTGRRIFRGQNLYVRGAGYAAKMIYEGSDAEYRFVADDVLRSSICIRAFKDGNFEEIPIANIGDPYESANTKIEVIMDRTNELDFIVHNVLKKDFICAIMTLETLNPRVDRSTRLDVRVRFPDRDTCVITVRDIGFGEIYKTDHKIWEQVLKI